MVNIGNYDARDHDPNQAFDPVPAGWYAMKIAATEINKTKDGKGQYLQVEHEFDERHHPDLKGRKVWDRLNLWHEKPEVRRIAAGQLSAICHAVGVLSTGGDGFETDRLHGCVLAVKLKLKAAEGKFDARNEVAGYDTVDKRIKGVSAPQRAPAQAAPIAAPPQSAPPPQGQPGQAAQPPWTK